jgi:hypothetical protein
VGLAVLVAQLVSVAHAHARTRGWSAPESACATCLFQLHASQDVTSPVAIVVRTTSHASHLATSHEAQPLAAPRRCYGRAPPYRATV